jgi:hypothetical protein
MTPFELPVSSCRLLILIVSISSPVEAVLILVIEGILTGPREVLHRGLDAPLVTMATASLVPVHTSHGFGK